MPKVLMAFLIALVKRILLRISQNLWDATWKEIIYAVIAAEEKWEENDRGKAKKEWVIKQVMEYLKEKADLSWLQVRVIKLFIGEVIDGLIDQLNEEIGHDWGKKVAKIRDILSEKILMID